MNVVVGTVRQGIDFTVIVRYIGYGTIYRRRHSSRAGAADATRPREEEEGGTAARGWVQVSMMKH